VFEEVADPRGDGAVRLVDAVRRDVLAPSSPSPTLRATITTWS